MLSMTVLASQCCSDAGNTYAPEGALYWGQGQPLDLPAEQPCLLKLAICSALCNDSSLSFAPGQSRSMFPCTCC